MQLQLLKNKFNELFKTDAETSYFAPGRINLIGEHIDYNGGLVFPCAITIGTYGVCSKRDDMLFRVYSMNFEELGVLEFDLAHLDYAAEHNWANYLKGVLKFLLEKGASIPHGLNLVISGNIPNGSGLSSSASLEMLSCKIFNDFYSLHMEPVTMALLGKKVENEYIGVNSGIMDQFAIALGKTDSALLLDCATQAFSYVPFKLDGYSIIIMNTNKRRELADSKYNERCSECASALKQVQTQFNVKALCELKEEDLPEIEKLITNETEFRRARHTITENARVLAAVSALENNDLVTLGKLLNGSHASLRDDYEVTGKELDTLVSSALEEEGVLGARMTGAGFGGCAIALVNNEVTENFIENVNNKYKEAIGYDASFYVAAIGNGPSIIHE